MEYIHIKNLEKYHPNYKDRELKWCKAYFSMINADPDFEMLCEIDKWRFLTFIMLELQTKKPIPLDSVYLTRKGFDLKKRPISLTLQMLHTLVETCAENVTQSKNKIENKNKKEIAVTQERVTPSDSQFLDSLKTNPAYRHIDIDRELGKMDAWLSTRPGRHKTRRFVVNWLNKIDRPLNTYKKQIENDFTNAPIPQRPEVDAEGLKKINELVRGVTNK